ncbi:MAG: hypothetical protein JST26_09925 [Bacteroidetes bacterium]|nr:hypothetical protein [Bacteroidota bacterium]
MSTTLINIGFRGTIVVPGTKTGYETGGLISFGGGCHLVYEACKVRGDRVFKTSLPDESC